MDSEYSQDVISTKALPDAFQAQSIVQTTPVRAETGTYLMHVPVLSARPFAFLLKPISHDVVYHAVMLHPYCQRIPATVNGYLRIIGITRAHIYP